MYREIFQRNYGVFDEQEQEKVREAKMFVIGCGEIGGAAAVMLARGGVEHFTLVDDDSFELSSMSP